MIFFVFFCAFVFHVFCEAYLPTALVALRSL